MMESYLYNEIKERQFYEDEKLKLPYSVRTYMDGISAEYQQLTIEQKVAHFAYLLKRDFPLYAEIRKDIDKHLQDPQFADYEFTCKVALTRMLDALSMDEMKSSAIILVRFMTFDAIYQLLVDQLSLSYVEYSTPQGKNCYGLKKLNCNYLEILKRYVSVHGLPSDQNQ